MSASRRRPSSRRSNDVPRDPGASDDDLPTLEPLDDDDLPTLEPDDDSPVTVAVVDADEDGFDVMVTVDVPEMPKADVGDAVDGPLRRAVAGARDRLRWRRTLVRFGGDAMIGTAVKTLTAEVLAPVKPLSVVVRRGFGDERVHEGTLPSVRITTRDEAGALHVGVDTGELDREDLTFALSPELARLAPRFAGRAVVAAFEGKARPDDDARTMLAAALRDSGATRATVTVVGRQPAVLFDTELEGRIAVDAAGGVARVDVTPADDPATTCAALDLVLPAAAPQLAGATVRAAFTGRAPRDAELEHLVATCTGLGAERIELEDGGRVDVLVPRLLRIATRDDQALLGVLDAGRDHDAVVRAFRREIPLHADALRGRRVTVDWPAGFALDEATETACLDDALGGVGAQGIACTFGGEDREPFRPEPVTVRDATFHGDAFRTVHIDTDAGKPAELARAIERRIGRVAASLRGARARVEIAGSGAFSRTMQRALLEVLEQAGVTRCELDDHGTVDVVLPALLAVGTHSAGVTWLAPDASGRDDAQVAAALARELDALGLAPGAVCEVAETPLAERVAAELVARGAGRVVLDGPTPVQVHPALFAAPARDGETLVLRANPDGDAAALAAQVARELPRVLADAGALADVDVTVVWPGASDTTFEPLAATLETLVTAGPRRLLLDDGDGHPAQLHPEIVPDYVAVLGTKDDATPPLVMLGIDLGQGDAHVAHVTGKLAELRETLAGRRVLLVARDRGRELAVRDDDAVTGAVRAAVDPIAAATLAYRGLDQHRRRAFEVVHSTVEALPVGKRFGDPRPGR